MSLLLSQVGAPPAGTNWTLTPADSVTVTDAVAKLVGKISADISTITDAVAKAVGKRPADSVTPADAVTKALGKAAADSVTPTDGVVKAVGKFPADSVTPTDSLMKAVGKSLSDSVTAQDSFARVVAYVRTFADTATAIDNAVAALVGEAQAGIIDLRDPATWVNSIYLKRMGVYE